MERDSHRAAAGATRAHMSAARRSMLLSISFVCTIPTISLSERQICRGCPRMGFYGCAVHSAWRGRGRNNGGHAGHLVPPREMKPKPLTVMVTSIVEKLGPLLLWKRAMKGEWIMCSLPFPQTQSPWTRLRAVLRFCLSLVVSDGPIKSTIASFQRWLQGLLLFRDGRFAKHPPFALVWIFLFFFFFILNVRILWLCENCGFSLHWFSKFLHWFSKP